MGSLDWGTIPAWASAILTSGSLTLGFYILLRDRRKEERVEASKIVCWRLWNNDHYFTHVLNASDRAVVDVNCLIRLPDAQGYEGFYVASVIKPGDEEQVQTPRGGLGRRLVPQFVTFQDSDGQFWIRDLPTGDLQRLPRENAISSRSRIKEYLGPWWKPRRRRGGGAREIVAQGRSEQ